MPKLSIHFFNEETSFNLKNKTIIRNWINQTIIQEKLQLEELNFIFCSDNYLLKINKEYLNHDTYTDIITFDNSSLPHEIVGDIFISIDRVNENAKTFKTTIRNELCRVMIHGVLHLLGYKDKSKTDKTLMTKMEDYYLLKFREAQ
jgi:probable rRNA maturation factor